ncbi:MAG: Holliday junction branch migration protein RuvA [bacterium]|jgi:Holliday junction DNA helicase RuvA
MITFLEGIIEDKQPTHVVLNVGGVGYEVIISLSSYDRLPGFGEKVRLLTHDHIREDAHQLFGFMTADERRVFTLLLGVSGIGPKIALSALSGMTVRELKVAIRDGDIKRLSSISGIGKKTAERMIVELRDKFGDGEILAAASGGHPELESDLKLRDAVLALISLGYKRAEAQELVVRVVRQPAMSGADVEAIVRKALAG